MNHCSPSTRRMTFSSEDSADDYPLRIRRREHFPDPIRVALLIKAARKQRMAEYRELAWRIVSAATALLGAMLLRLQEAGQGKPIPGGNNA